VGVPTPTIPFHAAGLLQYLLDRGFDRAGSGVDATIGVGMTVALVISPSATPRPDDRKVSG
jgi:hypothetical protein